MTDVGGFPPTSDPIPAPSPYHEVTEKMPPRMTTPEETEAVVKREMSRWDSLLKRLRNR